MKTLECISDDAELISYDTSASKKSVIRIFPFESHFGRKPITPLRITTTNLDNMQLSSYFYNLQHKGRLSLGLSKIEVEQHKSWESMGETTRKAKK